MATFIAKVRSKKGQIKNLTVEASNPFEAKKFLRKCGFRPLELQTKNSINPKSDRPQNKQFIATYQSNDGSIKSTSVNAINEKFARHFLRRRGLRAIEIHPFTQERSQTSEKHLLIQPSIIASSDLEQVSNPRTVHFLGGNVVILDP